MKAKKAIKRLHRADALLATVIDGYEAGTGEVQDLLAAARTSVASATRAVAALPARKPAGKAKQISSRTSSDGAGERLSAPAKKRPSTAARKGMAVKTA